MLPRKLYEQMRQLAAENQRSIAGEVRFALTLYVKQIERRKAAAT